MTRTIYETNGWNRAIKKFEAHRETDHCYFYSDGPRERRIFKTPHHHVTYAAARAHIIKCAESTVEGVKSALIREEKHLALAKQMPENEPT
jgi:hypothetical protein